MYALQSNLHLVFRCWGANYTCTFLLGKTFLVKLHCELKKESERCKGSWANIYFSVVVCATFVPILCHDFSSGNVFSSDLIKRDLVSLHQKETYRPKTSFTYEPSWCLAFCLFLLLCSLLPFLSTSWTSVLKGADLFIICQLSLSAQTLNVPSVLHNKAFGVFKICPSRFQTSVWRHLAPQWEFLFFQRLMDFLRNRISPKRVLNTPRRRSQIGWAAAYGWASPTQPASWLVKSRCRNCQWVNKWWSQKSSRLFGGSPEYWD